MSDPTLEPVRRPMLYRAVEVLAEESPLKRREALDRVGSRLADQFTDYEKATFRERDNTLRWENILSWETTAIRAAGWMNKEAGGWSITNAGRAALLPTLTKVLNLRRPARTGKSEQQPVTSRTSGTTRRLSRQRWMRWIPEHGRPTETSRP